MISAIILLTDGSASEVAAQREKAVRSLGWLVSAVVAGVVRDVTLAASAAMELEHISEKVGCRLVVADREGDRLKIAAETSRCDRVLVLLSGFQPIANLAEEIDMTQCRGGGADALVLRVPATFMERLFPDRAAVVGVVTSRRRVIEGGIAGFKALARATKDSRRLLARVQPIP